MPMVLASPPTGSGTAGTNGTGLPAHSGRGRLVEVPERWERRTYRANDTEGATSGGMDTDIRLSHALEESTLGRTSLASSPYTETACNPLRVNY